jgi:hypothetical protein
VLRLSLNNLLLALIVGSVVIPAHAEYFGFTHGTGVGSVGDHEVAVETQAKFGKRDGSYSAFKDKFEYRFTPWQDIRLEFAALAASHFIHNVTDFDDRDQTRFDGAAAELKWRFLKRGSSVPFSAALIVEPEFSLYSSNSGTRENGYGLEARLAFDTELIPNKLDAAVNFFTEPEVKHRPATAVWEREIDYGVSGALSYRLTPIVDVGAGIEYRRHYEPEFHVFEGDALYVGPSFAIKLNRNTSLEFAWLAQVDGHAVDDPRLLNLEEFSRQKTKLKLSYKF